MIHLAKSIVKSMHVARNVTSLYFSPATCTRIIVDWDREHISASLIMFETEFIIKYKPGAHVIIQFLHLCGGYHTARKHTC